MSDDNDESEGFFEEIDKTMEEIFFGLEHSLLDLREKCLKPLYGIGVTQDHVEVTVDLPFVEKREDLQVTSTGDTITIEAKMYKSVSLAIGGPYQRNVDFSKYSNKIKLPVRVDSTAATARFRNGILTIRLPVKSRGRGVEIR